MNPVSVSSYVMSCSCRTVFVPTVLRVTSKIFNILKKINVCLQDGMFTSIEVILFGAKYICIDWMIGRQAALDFTRTTANTISIFVTTSDLPDIH